MKIYHEIFTNRQLREIPKGEYLARVYVIDGTGKQDVVELRGEGGKDEAIAAVNEFKAGRVAE